MIFYLAAFAGSFLVLGLLKFVQDSPVRSWKTVVIGGVVLGLAAGYYANHAFPKKAPPAPAAQKVEAYRAELERTFRRINGVDAATVEGTNIFIDFGQDKTSDELKQIAMQCGGSAAYFFQTGSGDSGIEIHLTVKGQDRYEMNFSTRHGVTSEKAY